MEKKFKIIRFNEFTKEDYSFDDEEILRYHSFDVDDNLLYMPTKIHMEHLVDGEWIEQKVDTEEFARIRGDKVNWRFKAGHGGQESFVEFRDWGETGDDTFIIGFKKAVKTKKFGPSWSKFIECLVNGNIFSIITSRGHSPKNVKRAIEWLIYEYGLNKFRGLDIKNVDQSRSFEDQMVENLLKFHELFGTSTEYVIDEYLNVCPIYTISSLEFKKQFGDLPSEEAKKVALADFNNIVKGYARKLGVKAKYGFSDDDPKFVKSAVDQFRELKGDKRNKNIKYSVFDTGEKGMKKLKI